MKRINILMIVLLAVITVSCNKLLDRPPLTSMNDDNAWTSEDNLRLYANKYYTDFFRGYGEGWTTTGAAYVSFTLSDDVLNLGNQNNFTRAVPNSSIWGFGNVRSLNLMLDRIESRMSNILSEEAKNHWTGIGRFFRGLRYTELVFAYGDVPLLDREVFDDEFDELYKPRDPRDFVMDQVYSDLEFAFEHVRGNDGDQQVNKYVVAAFISRVALHEASWQKYYYKNNDRAKKFFEFAKEAADFVISSGRYDIVTDYRNLFASNDLRGNADVILYRHYDEQTVKHAIASNSNLDESIIFGPTTDLIKSYLCHDGETWENSSVNEADNFEIANLMKTRDPRFEASFHINPKMNNRGSLLYITKFLPREIEELVSGGGSPPPAFSGADNVTDYPVMRYAEVLLNWIEAKAELATLGGEAVSQTDIDKSINKIRQRPLAPEAVDRGVKNVDDLVLGVYPNDPNRDQTVSPLLWEIRREKRLEFTFEYSRINDLRRWSKLAYMDTDLNEDLLSGSWVNFSDQLPGELVSGKINELGVVDLNGQYIVYDGTNGDDLKGFYRNTSNKGRLPFLDQPGMNPYLSPVGKVQMDEYEMRGYKLQQTEGWPQN